MAMSGDINRSGEVLKRGRERLQDFFIRCMEFSAVEPVTEETIIRNCDRLGLPNIAVLLFEKSISYEEIVKDGFPSVIRLMCSVRDGELRVLSPERRLTQVQ